MLQVHPLEWGKAITTRFVQEGAKVVAVARRIERFGRTGREPKSEPGEIEIFFSRYYIS